MIILKINFKCPMCENNKDFYLMPLKERTSGNDYVDSLTKYEMKCKKCGKSYIISYDIKIV